MLFGVMKTKLWIIQLASLQLWVRLSASQLSPPPPPFPTLNLKSRSTDSAVLVCRAPGGHKGLQFALYRERVKVNSIDVPHGAEEVRFTVRPSDASQRELYCCLYKTMDRYSGFSPYLEINWQRDAGPSLPIPLNPDPPILSMEPSSGLVKRGEMLLFHCSLPPPLPLYQANSPVLFMLLRGVAADSKWLTVVPQAQFSHSLSSEPQPGVFSVGPVTGAEQGQYTCLYQVNRGEGLQNSSVSNIVQVTVTDLLPTPTLILDKQSDVWHLLCRGSPAYPGAGFSLYLQGHDLPVESYQAKLTEHRAIFSVPVQDTPVALYQCEYRVLLGRQWSQSERSLPLSMSQGNSSAPTADSFGVDWPLVLGSLSAVVLFLCSLALLIVMLHRKMKAAADAKKKREEAQFWTQVHGKDHIVDLTLPRQSFTSQDWTNGHTDSAQTSHLWNPLSTFTTPVIPSY
ncbi:hypothetical protein NL108_005002 [Boleophthalmus pectinirostris]|uniref:uncharacterized protein LOC110172651 isoform X1 n=1 Tax=Boleophthalmus pectinirostris TaxID=150288 RepID=UPI00242E3EEE|nr:uncharacterized protein LOC110172651 isoform X1 [Boleophthalmus pectinirostris]KAJ0050574.1 hypothetical protein NL108_005002 [Boleophthalmus pectinirostris]